MQRGVRTPHGINAVAWLFAQRAVRSLPTHQQARYREEFCAELTETTGIQQAVHAWRLFRSSAELACELRSARSSRRRLLAPLSAAVAVLLVAFTGVGLAARDAQPGDTLWGLTKVLYADHARSVEAAVAARADMAEAELALARGEIADAKAKLENAHAVLPTVSGADGKTELEAQHATLLANVPGN
jgi:hypothetical protein